MVGDRWAPAADSTNEWVHTTDEAPHSVCDLHTESTGDKPDWGEKDSPYGDRLCCALYAKLSCTAKMAQPGLKAWCNANCNHITPNCPQDQCKCTREG